MPDGSKQYGETGTDGKTKKVGAMDQKDIKLTVMDKEKWGQQNINVWQHEIDDLWS
jgi:hypothetical protein